MNDPKRLVLASGNAHKVDELRAMLAQVPGAPPVVGLDAFDAVPEIEETEDSFSGNADLKALGIARWLRARGETGATWVLADDSGICVDALDGAPGVRSARFAGEHATDQDNNTRLVERLEAAGHASSLGHYQCVLALTRVDEAPLGPDAGPLHFEGRWQVEVRTTARGTGGFGYDPHAWLPGGSATVAELGRDEKAKISHRGTALRALAAWIQRKSHS